MQPALCTCSPSCQSSALVCMRSCWKVAAATNSPSCTHLATTLVSLTAARQQQQQRAAAEGPGGQAAEQQEGTGRGSAHHCYQRSTCPGTGGRWHLSHSAPPGAPWTAARHQTSRRRHRCLRLLQLQRRRLPPLPPPLPPLLLPGPARWWSRPGLMWMSQLATVQTPLCPVRPAVHSGSTMHAGSGGVSSSNSRIAHPCMPGSNGASTESSRVCAGAASQVVQTARLPATLHVCPPARLNGLAGECSPRNGDGKLLGKGAPHVRQRRSSAQQGG